MNITNGNTKKLWLILAGLALAVALVIAIDFLPFHALHTDTEKNTGDALDSGNEAGDNSGDAKDVFFSGEATTFTLTFLGECAPGSPYGTDAYGSLNALTAEKGVSYFFSQIASQFENDDLTVAANRCVFTDEIAAECAAPLSSASIYADASIELILNLSPELDEHMVQAALPIQNTGVFVTKSDNTHYTGNENLRITLLTARLSRDSADALIERVRETAQSSEYLILYFYGGEVNSHVTEDWMTDALHACADAGADLIVGTGTGVLRPAETYNGVPIAYSLGCLIDGTQLVPENASAIMRCIVNKNTHGEITTDISYIPAYVYTELWQPSVMENEEDIKRVTDFLAGNISMPIETPAG